MAVSKKYQKWIKDNVPHPKIALGQCEYFSKLMQESFPELSLVSGFVRDHEQSYAHWWLRDSEGNIIDPTVSQFDMYHLVGGFEDELIYEEVDQDHPARHFPRRKCMECGSVFYAKGTFCDEKCMESFVHWQETGE